MKQFISLSAGLALLALLLAISEAEPLGWGSHNNWPRNNVPGERRWSSRAQVQQPPSPPPQPQPSSNEETTPLNCGARIVRSKPGQCPPFDGRYCFVCNDTCKADKECPGRNICCAHGCGNYCARPV